MSAGDVMDVTGSLRKISKELLELNFTNFSPAEVEQRLEAASWLLSYIADGLDAELALAAERGRALARKELNSPPGPNGVKDYRIISGDDI